MYTCTVVIKLWPTEQHDAVEHLVTAALAVVC